MADLEDKPFFYATLDPTSPLGPNTPALTTLMFKVCDNNVEKFNEACRLIGLFANKAIELHEIDKRMG